jgi:hypothetical protein
MAHENARESANQLPLTEKNLALLEQNVALLMVKPYHSSPAQDLHVPSPKALRMATT